MAKCDWISIGFRILMPIIPILLFTFLYFSSMYLRCSESMRKYFPVNFEVVPLLDSIFLGYFLRLVLTYYKNGVFTVIAVIPYFFHFIFPYLFIFCLVIQRRSVDAFKFGFLVGASSIIILIFQIFLPTAPPWAHSLNLNSTTIDSLQCSGFGGIIEPDISLKYKLAGRFSYFYDEYKISFVSEVFSLNKNVFGTFPSMHIAWVLCSILAGGWIIRIYWINYIHLLWLSWAVIYSEHHYVVDIFASFIFVFLADYLYKVSVRVTKTMDSSPIVIP